MKSQQDLSLWNIIDRMQRRLERQGVAPEVVDRAVTIALRHLARA